MQNPGEVVLGLKDFNELVHRQIDVLRVVMELVKEMLREENYYSFVKKELRVANTWFEKKEQRKMIGFVVVGKNNIEYLKDVKAIPGN